jgi:hypothetical protein
MTIAWNKALRLHPVIPSNARESTKNTILPYGGGEDGNAPLFVKRGTIVLYNVYSMHRDTKIFGENVEDFVPERWQALRPGWGYLPFNGGPRVCIGRMFSPSSLLFPPLHGLLFLTWQLQNNLHSWRLTTSLLDCFKRFSVWTLWTVLNGRNCLPLLSLVKMVCTWACGLQLLACDQSIVYFGYSFMQVSQGLSIRGVPAAQDGDRMSTVRHSGRCLRTTRGKTESWRICHTRVCIV